MRGRRSLAEWERWGGRSGPEDSGHPLRRRSRRRAALPPPPRARRPRHLAPDPAPRLLRPLPPGPEKGLCLAGALGKLISKTGVRRAFCFHVLPILFARFPLQSTDPSRPPLNPALAAGDSSTVTLFPLGPAWGLHRRSRKCAVPGPLPCSETRPRGCFFDTRPPASAVVAG